MTDDRALLERCDPPITTVVNGTRLHYWPSPVDNPSACLFFIPGNPGLADYYIAYLTELQQLVHSDGRTTLEIFCASQKGHDPLVPSQPSRPVSLDEQIEIKASILNTVCARWKGSHHDASSNARASGPTQPKLILGGHSIGAYMALEVVRRKLSPVPVSSVHLLFPTLHQIGQSPNARKLAWLIQANNMPSVSSWMPTLLMMLTFIISMMLRFVQILPLPIVHFLILIASPSQPPEAVRITSQFILRGSCVQQALAMARDEIRLVRQVQEFTEGDVNGREITRTKLRAYWASGNIDGWAPLSARYAVEEALGLQSYELPADIIDHHRGTSVEKDLKKKRRTFTIDEIRQVRRSSKRRALAGMVRAGATASYGIASSIGSIPYSVARRGAGASMRGPPPAPSSGMGRRASTLPSSPRGHKRRPSLLAARASRRFDGTIVIEPANSVDTDGEEVDWLAKDPETVGGLVMTPADAEPTEDEAAARAVVDDASRISTQGNILDSNGSATSGNKTIQMPDRASIVCRVGMPHAFVLEYADKMAAISSAMIIADAL